ncbi:FadR/GntR family transcriptional regulator [Nonomuraea endophytica]|uniref:DNA-binding FadR family transcriptional regulator n=1 Tax=Nonomuraea endophytica TaxID=714136 RepID=A0A7W8EFA1_9ACTN|nr:FCD domain-containing protein [Nonomuraea endophytica]MBB5076257.1 DNA-binding FadR family transcriptional regulator [Nonomuraea endophytica]
MTDTGWRPVKRTRAFEDVLAQIERRIVEDGLTVGDRLPGERQLAEQLQVGRSSVREALRVLETLGVVSSQAGRGPDAGAVLTSRPDSALTDLLRLHLGLASLELREVIDTRLMIERWAAAGAATARAGTTALVAALEGMERARTAEEFVEHDTAFHCAIADASGNRLIAAIMRSLRESVRRYAIEAVEQLGDTRVLQDGHRRILAAIDAGSPEEAARAVTDHLADAYPTLFPRP